MLTKKQQLTLLNMALEWNPHPKPSVRYTGWNHAFVNALDTAEEQSLPVDNEVTETHTVQNIKVTFEYDSVDGPRIDELGVMGFPIIDAIKVAQWLADARGDDIIAIKSI